MAKPVDTTATGIPVPTHSTGTAKFLRDVLSVLDMKLHFMHRSWQWYLLGALVFPMGMFF